MATVSCSGILSRRARSGCRRRPMTGAPNAWGKCRARRSLFLCRRQLSVPPRRLETRAQGQAGLARLAIKIAPRWRAHRLVVAFVEQVCHIDRGGPVAVDLVGGTRQIGRAHV